MIWSEFQYNYLQFEAPRQKKRVCGGANFYQTSPFRDTTPLHPRPHHAVHRVEQREQKVDWQGDECDMDQSSVTVQSELDATLRPKKDVWLDLQGTDEC
jgi:hypothetical protein